MAQQALVNPSLLAWARERAQMSIDVLSAKLTSQPDRIKAWENGEQKPTFKQAQKLAKTLHIPFGYLFLSKPPIEVLPIPDLRTIADQQTSTITPEFRDLLGDIKRKQEWYKDYVIENDEPPFEFFGIANTDQSIQDVANSIRNALELTSEQRNKLHTQEEYLRFLTEKTEALGVLVMRNSIVGSNPHRHLNVGEFRGFTMGDRNAPLIFINSSDANSAKVFTLIHELTHLWIAKSGISDVDLDKSPDNQTEKFCNIVSAEVLTPQSEFLHAWDFKGSIEENCSKISSIFKVSTFVVARRAYDLGLVDTGVFHEYYRNESENFEKIRQQKRKKQNGGSYYANVRVRNGNRFSRAVLISALEGRLLYRDAAALLNINPSKIIELSKEIGIK